MAPAEPPATRAVPARPADRSRRVAAPRAAGGHLSVFLRQLPFASVMLVIVVGVAVFDALLLSDDHFFTGLILALAATALSIIVPWRRMPRPWVALVPLLDMVAIAFLGESGFRSSSLLVLPVLWMASSFGARGLVLAVLAGGAAAWGSDLLDPTGFEPLEVQRLFLMPAVLAAVGLYVHLAERRSTARRDLLGRQSALVEEALSDARRQQRILEGILNTIDVGVVTLDADGRITTINRAHAAVVGSRLKIGDHVTVHGGVDGYAADGTTPLGTEGSPLVRVSRGEALERELTWWDQGDGTRRAFRISGAGLRDDDGAWAGAVVAYQDLTDEMAALAQREDFVSSVSHELRSPLTSMLGYLELALDDPHLPGPVRSHLQVVERNSERLERLIADLLTAAEARSAPVQLVRAALDLSEVVAEAVQNQLPRADAAEVTLRNHVATSCVIGGDRTRLTQVVDNLVSNAIKYSLPGGTVTLSLERDATSVRLVVADRGIGIAEADQEKLFSRFYRAETVRQGPVAGIGLGLHISQLIVERHGGRIELASTLGVGTTVEIVLPTEVAEA